MAIKKKKKNVGVSLGSTDKIRIHPPSKNARTRNSSGKLMAVVFWDMEGILLIEYMKKGSTITGEVL
jgi:hypothetical protein